MYAQRDQLLICQKTPTYLCGKRDLLMWQRRPTYVEKKAYLCGKRDLLIETIMVFIIVRIEGIEGKVKP